MRFQAALEKAVATAKEMNDDMRRRADAEHQAYRDEMEALGDVMMIEYQLNIKIKQLRAQLAKLEASQTNGNSPGATAQEIESVEKRIGELLAQKKNLATPNQHMKDIFMGIITEFVGVDGMELIRLLDKNLFLYTESMSMDTLISFARGIAAGYYNSEKGKAKLLDQLNEPLHIFDRDSSYFSDITEDGHSFAAQITVSNNGEIIEVIYAMVLDFDTALIVPDKHGGSHDGFYLTPVYSFFHELSHLQDYKHGEPIDYDYSNYSAARYPNYREYRADSFANDVMKDIFDGYPSNRNIDSFFKNDKYIVYDSYGDPYSTISTFFYTRNSYLVPKFVEFWRHYNNTGTWDNPYWGERPSAVFEKFNSTDEPTPYSVPCLSLVSSSYSV